MNISITQEGYISLNLIEDNIQGNTIDIKGEEAMNKLYNRLYSLDYSDKGNPILATKLENVNGLNVYFGVNNDNLSFTGHNEEQEINGIIDNDMICSDIYDICKEIGICLDRCEVESSDLEDEDKLFLKYQNSLSNEINDNLTNTYEFEER